MGGKAISLSSKPAPSLFITFHPSSDIKNKTDKPTRAQLIWVFIHAVLRERCSTFDRAHPPLYCDLKKECTSYLLHAQNVPRTFVSVYYKIKPETIPTVLGIDSPKNNKRGTAYTYARGTLCVYWVKGQKSVLIKKSNDSALMTFESCTSGKHSAYSVTFFFHRTNPPAKEENKLSHSFLLSLLSHYSC